MHNSFWNLWMNRMFLINKAFNIVTHDKKIALQRFEYRLFNSQSKPFDYWTTIASFGFGYMEAFV